MNRYTAAWGTLLAVSGVVMRLILIGLGRETFFMAPLYLPPAQVASYVVIGAGVALLVASLVVRWPKYSAIASVDASKYFARVTLVNALAAAVFAAPMLDPSLELPILLTKWPGIYIVVAYAFFVIFGVLGMLGWSVMYRFMPAFFSRDAVDRRSVLLQLVLSEVGVYTVSTVLFVAGFIGATLVEGQLTGDAVIGASMEFSDIPAAVAIFVVIVSVVLGAITILSGKPANQPASLGPGDA